MHCKKREEKKKKKKIPVAIKLNAERNVRVRYNDNVLLDGILLSIYCIICIIIQLIMKLKAT